MSNKFGKSYWLLILPKLTLPDEVRFFEFDLDMYYKDKLTKMHFNTKCVMAVQRLPDTYIHRANYFNSTLAPASSNLAFNDSASSLETPSLIALGAPSTNSLASFKPKPVNSLTTFTTPNF